MKLWRGCGFLLPFIISTLFAGSELEGYRIISEGSITLYSKMEDFVNAGPGNVTTEKVLRYKIRDKEGNVQSFKIRTLSKLLSDNPESMQLLKKQKRRYTIMVCLAPLIVPALFYKIIVPNPKSYMIEAVQVFNAGSSVIIR